jgi:hypothetical protein
MRNSLEVVCTVTSLVPNRRLDDRFAIAGEDNVSFAVKHINDAATCGVNTA